jgi:hypothetical protein
MTKQYKIVLLAAAAASAMFVAQARAEAQYQAVGSDGIAASPKVRLMLNERARSAQPPFTVATVSGGQPALTKTSTTKMNCCGQCCQPTTKTSLPVPSKQ